MVSPGTVRVTLESQGTLTQGLPRWVWDSMGSPRTVSVTLEFRGTLTQGWPGWVWDIMGSSGTVSVTLESWDTLILAGYSDCQCYSGIPGYFDTMQGYFNTSCPV